MALKTKSSKSKGTISKAPKQTSDSTKQESASNDYTELDSDDPTNDVYASTDDEAPVDRRQPEDTRTKKHDWSGLNESGVVYVGRIPHGFHETEISKYFGQFGEVRRVRLPRSKRTGNIRHYGFIEFADAQVAKVVCDTMDNYLLFGHLLKVKPVAPENVRSSMFRYTRVPSSNEQRLRKARKLYERRRTRDEWEEIKTRAEQRAKDRLHRLKQLGIDLERVTRSAKVTKKKGKAT